MILARNLILCSIAALPLAAESPCETFLKLIDRPRAALAAETRVSSQPGEPFLTERFTYASEASERVPGIAIKAAGNGGAKLPVVIALHGTGGNKEGQLPLLRQLAQRGFLAVAIDGRHHGERAQGARGSAAYVAAMAHRYRTGEGFPFLYDTVWDLLRLLDYLESRPDVDPARIGAIGFSKGGMELYLAAAADSRLRASVPCIGVQSFRWALDHDAWQSRVSTFQAAADQAGTPASAKTIRAFYDRVAPGIYTEFDGPQMLPLIAPRPLLVINGDSDARTPLPGLMQCVDAAKAAYQDHPGNFEFVLQPNTGHRVNPEALDKAIRWLTDHLRR
jgi:dienelactone hydrolase